MLIAYREDFYLEHHRGAFDAVLRKLAENGRPTRVVWHEADLTLMLGEPPPKP